MAADKERLDLLLVEQGFFATREKAKASIMAGLVLIDDEPLDKAGTKVLRTSRIIVKGAIHPYVSRGGLKLEKALKQFDINLNGVTMLDIGASTGGFTDCALQNGAAEVYAVDVGYNQLDWSMRNDPRVKVMERTNFRFMKPEDLTGTRPTFASIDVSFISLKLILPPLKSILSENGEVVALIKPQFEAGRDKVPKTGVVREPAVHTEVLEKVLGFAEEAGFHLKGLTFSPIRGGEGNVEFLAYFGSSKQEAVFPSDLKDEWIRQVVSGAQKLQNSSDG
jgi:23S rRNA (cytidine1920-2'-O)/16S rRNA (cytidine1409-2'-O)-methyltransferase